MITVAGPFSDAVGAHRWTREYILQPDERYLVAAHTYDLDRWRQTHGPLVIDVEHDGQPVGRACYLERTTSHVNAVGVVDVDLSGEWFWSATVSAAQHDGALYDLAVTGLSLVRRPAALGLSAIVTIPGDVTNGADRHRWPPDRTPPLVTRAARHFERTLFRRDQPLVLHGQPTPEPPPHVPTLEEQCDADRLTWLYEQSDDKGARVLGVR